MFYTQEDLALADRHIRRSEAAIDLQQSVISSLRLASQPTRLAERLLKRMQDGLALRRQHRDVLEGQINGLHPHRPAIAAA